MLLLLYLLFNFQHQLFTSYALQTCNYNNDNIIILVILNTGSVIAENEMKRVLNTTLFSDV